MNYIIIKKNLKDEISFIASASNYAEAQKIRTIFTGIISNEPYEVDNKHNKYYIICTAPNAEDYYKLKRGEY